MQINIIIPQQYSIRKNHICCGQRPLVTSALRRSFRTMGKYYFVIPLRIKKVDYIGIVFCQDNRADGLPAL